jgi:MarR family transcriptional repressor of emrRAB
MVDALEARGLVERRPTLGKWVAVHPTDAGRAASADLLDARGDRLTALVGTLPQADQEALAHALDRLLRAVYAEVGSAQRLCRLCDRPACIAAGAICPVGQAERDSAVRDSDAGDSDAGDSDAGDSAGG